MLHICMLFPPDIMYKSCHTYKRVKSHVWMVHGIRTNDSYLIWPKKSTKKTLKWYASGGHMYIHTNELCLIWISHIWMSHIKYTWVMSRYQSHATCAWVLSLSHTLCHTLSLSHTHTHTACMYISLSRALSRTPINETSLSPPPTHTHTHTHTHSMYVGISLPRSLAHSY